MFQKNDRPLSTVRALTAVLCVLVGVIGGFTALLTMTTDFVWGLLSLILSVFGAWWAYWIAELIFSTIVDIKLIRNRLYHQSNESLAEFLKDTPHPPRFYEQARWIE